MVDYAGAIRKPFQDLKTLAIGIVLMIAGAILSLIIIGVIPLLAVEGYLVRTAKGTLKGNSKMVEWGDWVGLIIDGIKAIVIVLVYLIPAIIAFVLTVGVGILSGNTTAAITALLGAGIISLILAILGGFFGSAGVLNFAGSGNIMDGFAFGAILKKSITGKYIIGFIVAAIVSIVAGVIPLLSILLVFPASVASITILSESYK